MNWYVEVLKKYAVFDGRARRREYWMFFLLNILISFAIGLVAGLTRIGELSVLYSLSVLIPGIAVSVRRMHDTDHSGWWVLVPIVNFVFAVTEGSQGENRFGADPKAKAYAMTA